MHTYAHINWNAVSSQFNVANTELRFGLRASRRDLQMDIFEVLDHLSERSDVWL